MAYDPAWSDTATAEDPRERLVKAMLDWEAKVTPAKQAELTEYKPSWRDRIARALMGDEKASPQRERAVEMLMGSRGLGNTGPSIVDFTPAGIPLAGNDAERAAGHGDWTGATLNAMAMIPAAKPEAMAAKAMADKLLAARAPSQSTLRAKNIDFADVPTTFRDASPERGRYYDEEFRASGTRPDLGTGIRPDTPRPAPQPEMQRVWNEATDTYTFRPKQDIAQPVMPDAKSSRSSFTDADDYVMQPATQQKLGRPADADPNKAFKAGEIPNRHAGPSLTGDTPAPHGAVWMINSKGEVRNSLEIPGNQIIDGKTRRDLEGWHPLYDAGPKAKELTPEELAASRHMWGSPTGSLWNQAWMPSEAPQGVKDAVQQVAKGKTWGDVLTETVAKMREAGTPPEEIKAQMPAIASTVARSLAAAHDAAGIKPPEVIDAKTGKSLQQSWNDWLQGKWDDALSLRLEKNKFQKGEWPASLIAAGERRAATDEDSAKIRNRLIKQMMKQVKGGGLQ